MADPEERPPVLLRMFADANEPELLEFYAVLGSCVSSWAFIDRRLYEIFHEAFGGDHRQSALMFYRQRAFNNRLRLVHDTLRATLRSLTFEKKWTPLWSRLDQLSHTRNVFVHHPAKRTATSKAGKPISIYTIHIEPYERVLNSDYPGLLGKDELTLSDLRVHDRKLEVMEKELSFFLRKTVVPECGD